MTGSQRHVLTDSALTRALLLRVSHLAEAFLNGAEIWKHVIPHRRVLLALGPDKPQQVSSVNQQLLCIYTLTQGLTIQLLT